MRLAELVWHPRNRRFGFLDAMAVLGATGLFVARFVPVATLVPFWGCTFRKVTGWPCPGCGLTRTADFFTHGRILDSALVNPLGFLGILFFSTCIVYSVLHFAFALPTPELRLDSRLERRLPWLGAAALLANWGFMLVRTGLTR